MTKENLKSMSRTISKAGLFVLLFAIPYPCRAFALMKLWKWFIIPMFGLPRLPFWTAMGGVLLSALVLVNVYKNNGDHIREPAARENSTALEDLAVTTGETVARTGIILVIAYILHFLGPN
jgi:hypothetical protein